MAGPEFSASVSDAQASVRAAESGDGRLMRVGGLVGTVGGLLMLVTFVFVGARGLPDPAATESLVQFPEIRHDRAVENLLYLAALVFWAVHHTLLHRLVYATAPMLSDAARTVGFLGVAVLVAGALLNVSTAPMSQEYQRTAEADRAGVVLAWQSGQGVMDAMLTAGALLLPVALVLFGLALRRTLGTRLGWSAVVLGVVGLVGATVAAAAPPSALVMAGLLSVLVFHLLVGIRCLQLSHHNTPVPAGVG